MTESNNQAAVTAIAEESPEAAGLVYQIITASMDANNHIIDQLYEAERRRRQALEVLIDDVLANLENAHMGSAREYERAVAPLWRGVIPGPEEDAMAARHRDNASS